MPDLLKMLTYRRPEGSKTQEFFCKKFLNPVMGKPDLKGNYTFILGDKPKVAFMAHHDTVHRKSGTQKLTLDKNLNHVTSDSNCLGADCTTGVWLILEMIKAGVEGVYIVHAAEEVGLIGSEYLVERKPDWFSHVEFAISFDRYGYDSIITHQSYERTCSEEFSNSLNSILKGIDFVSDPGGTFTDSYSYRYNIPECTNLSVGYFNQHTHREYQDVEFANQLLLSLINADWGKLVSARDPKQFEVDYGGSFYGYQNYSPRGNNSRNLQKYDSQLDYGYGSSSGCDTYSDSAYAALHEVILNNPSKTSIVLQTWGFTAEDFLTEFSHLTYHH